MYTKNQEEKWVQLLERNHQYFVSEAPFLINSLQRLSSRCLDEAIGWVDEVELTPNMREQLSDLLQEIGSIQKRIETIETLSTPKEDFMSRQKRIDDLIKQ